MGGFGIVTWVMAKSIALAVTGMANAMTVAVAMVITDFIAVAAIGLTASMTAAVTAAIATAAAVTTAAAIAAATTAAATSCIRGFDLRRIVVVEADRRSAKPEGHNTRNCQGNGQSSCADHLYLSEIPTGTTAPRHCTALSARSQKAHGNHPGIVRHSPARA